MIETMMAIETLILIIMGAGLGLLIMTLYLALKLSKEADDK